MPADRTLACVFAHPDDDASGAAVSVALLGDEGLHTAPMLTDLFEGLA